MISRDNLTELLSFDPEDYLTTTLYLEIDASPQQGHLIELKDLIKHSKKDLEGQKVSPEASRSVQEDLRKITDFVALEFSRGGARTLIICSCSGKKFWKVFTLSVPLRSHLVVNSRPYWRPLSFVLDEYSRYLVILIERAKARLFEVYAGEVLEHSDILHDVPRRVKEGGYGGYEERRIERHIADHVRWHMKKVADAAFELYKKYSNDAIILFGSEQNTSELRHFLPHIMQEQVVASEPEELSVSPQRILERTLGIDRDQKERQERSLLQRLFSQVNSDSLGVVSLDATIRALALGQVNYLVVREGFAHPGSRCTECGSLLTKVSGNCDYCGAPTQALSDVVDEAVKDALLQGCQVKYITTPDTAFSAAGNIGAMLRFRV